MVRRLAWVETDDLVARLHKWELWAMRESMSPNPMDDLAQAQTAIQAQAAEIERLTKALDPFARCWPSTMAVVETGFDDWAAKDHNKKWVKRIDGTPIRNDLIVCITNALRAAGEAPAATVPSDEEIDDALLERLQDIIDENVEVTKVPLSEDTDPECLFTLDPDSVEKAARAVIEALKGE